MGFVFVSMSVVELSGEVGREVRVREGWSERGMERDREKLGAILICGESMDVSIS